jgi:hypothetical protein
MEATDMLDILTASPSVGAWKHQPMTVAEVDAHPDADRIWATIKAMQDGVKSLVEEGVDDVLSGGDEYSRGYDAGVKDAKAKASARMKRMDTISSGQAAAILTAMLA